ncbi:HAMP domain-containing histidine kinase [Clostridium bowmanii]|uniref:sensor histidine kinase n=1 Tax=Clostridium bowmanii TaxID=132925 RepID=UPI001C0BBFCB|nr:HAMP domain-containing sensor histidine kinase [Clostridium bowmanii]MBU3190830.1 HAMP domain-containing histidine kinase [Clostridium bowmanii]MCA1075267.1 HAMP domain-containing histidine kinase [Clostridium bowmanii]
MKSIALKLWSGMIALVVVMLLLLWLFQIVFLEKFYTGIKISEVKNKGYSILSGLDVKSGENLESTFETFASKTNSNVEFLDSKGETLYSAGSNGVNSQMPMMMMNNSRLEAINAIHSGKEVTLSLIHPKFQTTFILIGLPYNVQNESKGGLIISMPLAPVKDTVSILKVQLFYITLILLFIAFILAYFLSRSFTKPILEITKVSEKMASGNFSVKIKSKGKDEIGRLAMTINYMGEELSKIEQLRKDLIANVSHELRTPLSLIRGYAETIRDVTGNVPQKRDKQLEIIIEESERLSKIVDDILNLSQIQAGYINLNKMQFNISELLERVIAKFQILSEKTGVDIAFENNLDKVVEADEVRIEQVMYNLINNAFNHTKSGGHINIREIENEKNLRIEVTDTGIGISEEDLKHIWDRFYKTDKIEGIKSTGSGLGLTIVKTIFESHGFKYGVESEKGTGTMVWFEI